MAKALFGHVGPAADTRLATELRRLRLRVRELEAELDHARMVNEALASRIDVSDDLRALDREPALT